MFLAWCVPAALGEKCIVWSTHYRRCMTSIEVMYMVRLSNGPRPMPPAPLGSWMIEPKFSWQLGGLWGIFVGAILTITITLTTPTTHTTHTIITTTNNDNTTTATTTTTATATTTTTTTTTTIASVG